MCVCVCVDVGAHSTCVAYIYAAQFGAQYLDLRDMAIYETVRVMVYDFLFRTIYFRARKCPLYVQCMHTVRHR